MEVRLENKTVVVTGGSRGIGLETGRLAAASGADVVLAARRGEVLGAAAESIAASTGRTVTTVPVDVTVPGDLEVLVARAVEAHGAIDVLVNNAGTGIYKPFLEVTEEDLGYGMAINFFAQFRLSQRVVPVMLQGSGGTIVNVSGLTGLRTLPGPFTSSCTGPAKAAEIQFTKALAAELGPHNIRVNCVVPGRIDAPDRLVRWGEELLGEPVDEHRAGELRRSWGDRIRLPGHRWGTTGDIASAIVFLASAEAGFVTGSVVVVDGGEAT
jgi:3-oxoacyl-[acyl-carrier protein] reductase